MASDRATGGKHDSHADVSLDEVKQAHQLLKEHTVVTPVWEWDNDVIREAFPADSGTHVFVKLELLQHGGSFKTRPVCLRLLQLSEEERAAGVTAVSGGNHGVAVATAAARLGVSAKVVLVDKATPAVRNLVTRQGADLVIAPLNEAFSMVNTIAEQEKRTFLHPYEGRHIIVANGGVALEFHQQAADLDVLIIACGGGGLLAGVSCVSKMIRPETKIIGVEPTGADTMHRSFATGKPERIDKANTIAATLGAPFATQGTFDVCMRHVDQLVKVTDDEMCEGMARLFAGLKLAPEPACAAAVAAMIGPLRDQLIGKRVGVVACGSNISSVSFYEYLQRSKWLAGYEGR